MEITVRPARPDDRDPIAAFTADTFTWGDYIDRVFDQWLDDDRGVTMVAEADGRVAGMARVAMMSPDEAWAQGARVHPEFRRQGISTAVTAALEEWAIEQGGRVVRLAVEDLNDSAIAQVVSAGFRPVSRWLYAERGVGENSPVPEGNGGRRVMAPEGLRPAPSAEAEPALMAWASGELEQASRSLYPIGWRWCRLKRIDIENAARERALWEGRPGWAIAEMDEDTFAVSWMVTTEDDAPAMVRALVDRAAAAGAERIEVKAPAVEWMRRALAQRGCEVHHLTIFAKPL